jgi:hypothetical protein
MDVNDPPMYHPPLSSGATAYTWWLLTSGKVMSGVPVVVERAAPSPVKGPTYVKIPPIIILSPYTTVVLTAPLVVQRLLWRVCACATEIVSPNSIIIVKTVVLYIIFILYLLSVMLNPFKSFISVSKSSMPG